MQQLSLSALLPDADPPSSGPIGAVDRWARENGYSTVIGVDEVGRGPLAGPVVAAAVVLGEGLPDGVDDSKKLTDFKRRQLAHQIVRSVKAFGIARVEASRIDEINILAATFEAMRAAILQVEKRLGRKADLLLVDGKLKLPHYLGEQRALVGGDHRSLAIASASILAKVSRDCRMIALDKRYPGYGFAQHKGYGTLQHRIALEKLGPCPEHRKSFAFKSAELNKT